MKSLAVLSVFQNVNDFQSLRYNDGATSVFYTGKKIEVQSTKVSYTTVNLYSFH